MEGIFYYTLTIKVSSSITNIMLTLNLGVIANKLVIKMDNKIYFLN